MGWKSLTQKILGRRKIKPYVLVREGRAGRIPDPLPTTFPALYRVPPHDDFARRDALLADAKSLLADFVKACHMKQPKLPELFLSNIELLLDIPLVYETQLYLKAKKMTRLYANNFAVAGMFQTAVFFSRSEMAERLREDMMLGLLGIFVRYYGVNFVSQGERDTLVQKRKFDAKDPKQREMREQFLEHYRQVADKMSRLSADRFHQAITNRHGCSDERMHALIHVIRYTPRLMGRTAEHLKPKELEKIHPLASYIAMVHNFASAWTATKKRVGIILAEEWSRAKMSHRFKDIHANALYNLHALSDLFHLCRCKMLCNFQGSGRDAIYSTTDNVLMREVAVDVPDEIPPPADEASGDDEQGSEKVPMREVRWRCYQPQGRLDHRATSLRDAITGKVRFGGQDPTDTTLLPLD